MAGLVLLAALGAWVALGAGGGAGRPAPVLWLLASTAAVAAAARRFADHEGVGTLSVVTIAIAGTLVLTWPGALRSGGAPTGYANANATLASIGLLGAVASASAAQRDIARRWWALAAGLAVVVLLTRSLAGATTIGVALVLLVVGVTTRRVVATILGGAVAVVLLIGVTVAIAEGDDPLGVGSELELRADLWNAALEITRDEPIQGIGPAQFEVANPVSADRDLRWAHHGYLQLAAETGVPGLVLGLVLLGWAYARLALASRSMPHRAVVGTAAVTVVALHAAVDHVLHHPAVTLSLAAVVGATTAHRPAPARGSRG